MEQRKKSYSGTKYTHSSLAAARAMSHLVPPSSPPHLPARVLVSGFPRE